MDAKRVFKTPFFWVLAVIAITVVMFSLGGDSGYTTIDAPKPDTAYTKGVVAMAKSQFEQPGTGGSQFFIVTADNANLPPDYAVVGKVVDGMDVVEKIGKLGNARTERPTEKIVIESTEVSGS